MDPPTQTCPELCMPSSACAKGLNVLFAIAAVTAGRVRQHGKAADVAGNGMRTAMRFTVGVNPSSHDGNACSSLDFQ